MLTYLRRLTDERTSLTETATRTADAAASDNRDLTEVEAASLANIQARCAEIDAALNTYGDQLDSARSYATLLERIEATTTVDERTPARNGRTPAAVEQTSWGRTFVESDQFRSYIGRGQSGVVELADYLDLRAPITSTMLPVPHFILPPVEQTSSAPLLGICGHVTVSAGIVDWVEIGPDPVAAVVAEGAAKPEAAVPLTPKSAALETLAHWVQITRQALEDSSYIQAIIEGKLRRGLLAKAETDMAAAIDAATTQVVTAAAGSSLLENIRVGVGMVQAAGYQPNAVALNPADFAALDIAVMVETTYGPITGQSFWGMRPVPVASIPAGKAYVGDFVSGATLFDRGVTSTFVTDSHAALFISNILVILAEARVKSAVTEPLAICECSAGAALP